MPLETWSDIEVGDRVQVVYRESSLCGRQGVVVRADEWGARVAIDGEEGDTGFSYRSSLEKLSNPPPKRPISPIFYTIKEPQHVMG